MSQTDSPRNVEDAIGKTIAAIEEVDWNRHESFVIRFTDGTALQLTSADMEDYGSDIKQVWR
jgi:hypothetical protein